MNIKLKIYKNNFKKIKMEDIKTLYDKFYDLHMQIFNLKEANQRECMLCKKAEEANQKERMLRKETEEANQKERMLRKEVEKERVELEYDKEYYAKELREERVLRSHLEDVNEYYKTQISKNCIFDGERNKN